MKRITEKEISKLKQLDRIEYRQKREEIDEKHKTDFAGSILKFSAFIMLLISFESTIGLEKKLLIELTTRLFKTLFWFTLICIVFMFINAILEIIERRKLNEEYFKIEMRRKR